ncbi:TonB-dependent receptor [Komagataeibacter sp. AV436]|uniref:TonB-dependent receptor n=1 Tax=Komagataeibacter melomenusus TaxID=2766578 RepID=A0ABX2ABB8_9PROT|nr:TonB-dependent receptor [Komagataeibacter melomenusus]MBV1830109.1 TonB-dependent receptor [Komagataeibacter melomenusus]NPC65584.1 TonB-dependent receptor [Komagataeibacter melomenusus]
MKKTSVHPDPLAKNQRRAPLSAAQHRQTGAPVAQQENIRVQMARQFAFTRQQQVADSNTRISADTLVQRRVVAVTDLQALAPNLTIQPMKGTQSVNYHLRGVGFDDYYENNMSSVMVYLDDVAYPFSSMTDGMMFDIAGVDIAPGPTGFTHGMADTGGEVSLHTADPTPQWHGGITEDIASYARSRTTGYVSGPLSDTVSFRIAASTSHGGGWQYNPTNGEHLGDQDQTSIRAKLKWTPDDKTTVMIGGHWTTDKSELINGNPVLNLDPSWQKLPTYTSYRQTEWDIRPQFAKLIGRPDNLKPSEDNIFWGADVRFVRDLNFAKFQSVSAFETERQSEYSDEDGYDAATGDTYRNVDATAFSQEVKLLSREDRKLQWGVGMYYLRSQMHQQFFSDFTQYIGRGYMSNTYYDQNQQTFSQYVNVSYKLPFGIKLFGGLNHESDDRQIFNYHTIQYGHASYSFLPEGTLTNQLGGMLGIQKQIRSNLMMYFKISKGFKPGGFAANNTVRQEQLKPFKPESVLSYELGFKSDPIPGKLRLNGAAFYYDYHNQQQVESFLLPNYGMLGAYVNIPHSNIWGVEFNAEIHPFRHLYINQNLGYQRGTYSVFNALDTTRVNNYHSATGIYKAFYKDYSGEDMGSPKLTLSGSAAYRIQPIPKYEAELGLNWSYRDSQAMTPGGNGVYRLPPYFLLGSYASFGPTSKMWSVTVYATNLLNRQYSLTSSSDTTTYQHVPGEPRFVGGRFSFNM